MSSTVTRFKDVHLLHPSMDFAVIPFGLLAAWLAIVSINLSAHDEMRLATYAGLITLSGLSMAAVTFARSTLYGAHSDAMAKIRDSFKEPLRNNWRSIIRDTFIIAVAGILCFWVDAVNPALAVYIAGGTLALLAARVLRAFAWMEFSQRIEIIASRDRIIDEIPYANH